MEKFEIIKKHKESGVIFLDETSVYIDEDVIIGKGTKIYPNVVIEGNTKIGENVIVGMSTNIVNSTIDDEVEIQMSVIKESQIGKKTTVGPFAYLRPGSKIGENCKIGDFVEVKNSLVGNGSKASHLTYIGDADIGEGVNLGCGVVFVNYDGANKYRSKVEDGVFVGCNSNIVSPVCLGRDSYIAAGSTVTDSVEAKSLYIGRSRGVEKKNWTSPKKIK